MLIAIAQCRRPISVLATVNTVAVVMVVSIGIVVQTITVMLLLMLLLLLHLQLLMLMLQLMVLLLQLVNVSIASDASLLLRHLMVVMPIGDVVVIFVLLEEFGPN